MRKRLIEVALSLDAINREAAPGSVRARAMGASCTTGTSSTTSCWIVTRRLKSSGSLGGGHRQGPRHPSRDRCSVRARR